MRLLPINSNRLPGPRQIDPADTLHRQNRYGWAAQRDLTTMESINHFNLRSFDLNLLLAFDALMQESSVTRAAARLKIQQPAMSHALANLRTVFDDVLFVRSGHTLEATPRARALYDTIHPILVSTQNALRASKPFEPRREERTFRLGINGQFETMLAPALAEHLGRLAPGIRIQSLPLGEHAIHRLLDEDHIDLAIAHAGDDLPRMRRATLYRERYVCCFHPALLAATVPISEAAYFGAVHGVVSARADLAGFLDYLLQHAGGRMGDVHSSHNVLTLLAMAAQAPVVASVHAHVAARYAPLFGLAVSPLPFSVDPLQVDMIWHPRGDHDSALAWLRAQVQACLPGPVRSSQAEARTDITVDNQPAET